MNDAQHAAPSPRAVTSRPTPAGPPVCSDVHVVVAAYNEERVIARTVRELVAQFPNVVVVDDGSRDRTAEEARSAGAMTLRHPINLGQGAALQTGITYAVRRGARYVATFDADGQHQAADLARMLDVLESTHADIALGSRFLGATEGIPFHRKLLLKTAVLFTNVTTGTTLSDAHNGLRLMTADVAGKIRITQNGMAHASEFIQIIGRLGLHCVEVPVHIRYTPYSLAKGQRVSGVVSILSDLLFSRLGKW